MTKTITVLPMTEELLPLAASYLLPYENTCIALTGRLYSENKRMMPPDNSPFFIFFRGSAIIGICMISDSGLMLHHFDDYSDDAANALAKLLADKTLYCITGDKNGTDFIKRVCWQKPRIVWDYELRVHDGVFSDTTSMTENFAVHTCRPSDADALFPLQKGYDVEEVIPPGDPFSEAGCRANLHKMLSSQLIYAAQPAGTQQVFCAKAGTNARSPNWGQVGGVYTLPEYRGNGLAAALVTHTARELHMMNKKAALFVKTGNESAKRAYDRAHFIPAGFFAIVYY